MQSTISGNSNSGKHSSLITLSKTLLCFLLVIFKVASSAFAQPTISSFSPTSGPIGSTITITGTNFSTTPSNNIVFFGAVKANVSAATNSSLTVTAPAGAACQPITVTVNGLVAYSRLSFIPTFASGGDINSTSFGEKVDFTTDLHPNGIAVTDLDGDGKPDLVTPNNYIMAGQPASISILRNTSGTGMIDFAPKIDIANGAETYALATGEIDGDGKPDIVACSIADQNISVFRNTSVAGSISFAPKINFACGPAPFSICIGDIDGDGKPDILVVNSLGNSISLYRNTGSVGIISFAPAVDFTTGLSPYRAAIGDMDGDGKMDIAVTNNLSNSFSVFRNTSSAGSLSFAARIDVACGAGIEPRGIILVDVDGDGKLDIPVATYNNSSGSSMVKIFKNTSTPGNFSVGNVNVILPGGSGDAYLVTAGDVNGDGKPDIALSATDQNLTKLFQNYSTPGVYNFPGTAYDFPSFTPYAISLGDLDSDSRPDLIATDFIAEHVSVLRNRSGLPGITFFTPAIAGTGATVNISGNNFTGATSVTFGGVAASSFTVVNSNTITAVVGAGASGDIIVTSALGSGSKTGFTFAAAPTISSFTPTSAGNGTVVTITGTNFSNASAVSFGGVAASSFTVVDNTTITAMVSNGASGNVNVTSPGGTASSPGFTYLAPSITSFTPISGGQGTIVTINGNSLNGISSVSFGGVPSTSISIYGPNMITARVGLGATGNVVVVTSSGTATAPGFTYTDPIVSSFTPTSGNAGTVVTITGINFTGATGVSFGGTPASLFTVVNATTITAVVSAIGASGSVSVTNAFGTHSLPGFTYTGPPIIGSFSPVSAGAGSTITISGANFTGVTSVSFGGQAALSFTVVNGNTINAVVGSGNSGSVSVTTSNGTASLAGFTFVPIPKINSFLPLSGLVGTTVTITGENFSASPANNTVYFGAVKANVTAASTSSLTVEVPIGATYQNISVLVNGLTAFSTQPFLVKFNNNGVTSFNNSSFAARVNFETIAALHASDIADFDGDNKPDVAVINQYVLGVSVLKNNSTVSNLSFATPLHFQTGYQSEGLSAKDLDGDGKPEIIVGGGIISVLRNTSSGGTISFASSINLPAGGGETHHTVADIDQDGKPDIITANYYGEGIGVLRNTSVPGILSFAPKVTFNLGGRSLNVAVRDIDGDNKPDIITTTGSADALVVFRNTSTPGLISFASAVSFSVTGSAPQGLAVGDLDGDDKPDVVTASYLYNNATMFRNTSTPGTISFAVTTFNANVGGPFEIGLNDLNGDGKLDMAITNGAFISVFKNTSTTGNISFDPKFEYQMPGSFNVSIGDLDGDGRPDLAGQLSSNGTFVSILRNKIGDFGITSFSPATGIVGTTITITGIDLAGATAVSFGGTPAASFTVLNATTITAVVANGATGNVAVTTPSGTASVSGFTFISAPTINSFSPIIGATGTSITITGSNFTGTTSVSFGGTPAASFTVVDANTIVAIVGTGSSGNVTITSAGGAASFPGFIFNPVTAVGNPAINNSKELVVSPNPGDNDILIKHPVSTKNASIRFVDILGREVKVLTSARNSSQTSTSVKGMEAGIYQIIWSDGKKILTRTFMVK